MNNGNNTFDIDLTLIDTENQNQYNMKFVACKKINAFFGSKSTDFGKI